MNKKSILYVVVLICLMMRGYSSYSQSVVDSLELELRKVEAPKEQIKILIQIADEYSVDNAEKVLSTSEKALKLSKKVNDTLSMMECHYQIASAYLDIGNYEKSIDNYRYLESLALTFHDKVFEAKAYYGNGVVNYYLGYLDEALKFWERELVIEKEINDSMGIALTLGNLSAIYVQTGDTIISLKYDEEALQIYREINDEEGIANALYNIAATYIELKRFDEALSYSKEALRLNKKTNKLKSISLSYLNIASIFTSLGELNMSNQYLDSAVAYAKELENLNELSEIYKNVADNYFKNNSFKKAYEYNDEYLDLYASLSKIENRSIVTEMNTKYETEKKEKANELLRKQGELDALEITSQRYKAYYLFGGLGVAFVLLIIIFNRFKMSQKQKKQIEAQKMEVEHQKELIEEKSTEITDSINYAQRIQQALLKSEEHVSSHFPPHFILLKPKDIVSGDFYWAIEKQGYLYVAVSDCTGHGVPGAFMSMLGIAFLNEINSGENLLTPAEILDELRNRIIRELSQTGSLEGSKDGMDMCLIRLDKDYKEIEWAGANNPLYIVNGSEVKEIKADRQPVAFYDFSKPFTNHSITIEEPSCLYMFSDGYVDQFGGNKGKKFKTKQYKELLLRIFNQDMDKQKVELNLTFENWRGDLEQIDDVCVVGLRI